MSASGGLLANARRQLRQIGDARASWAWLGCLLIIHAAIALGGGLQGMAGWYETLGLSREAWASGRFWTILSHGFLHGSWLHVGLNGVFLLAVGARIEHMLGRRVLGLTIILGILGGGVAHLALGRGLLVGFSGACMAILLLLTTLSPQSRMLPVPLSARSLALGLMIGETLLALIHPGLGLPGFAAIGRVFEEQGFGSWFLLGHACHVGGGIAGWCMGRWILRPRVTIDRLRRERARRETERG